MSTRGEWIPNKSGCAAPPKEIGEFDRVDIRLGGSMVKYGDEYRYEQYPSTWDWQPQNGVEITHYRIVKP
jgi:hypothetical protein